MAYVKASNTQSSDQFGRPVALDGATTRAALPRGSGLRQLASLRSCISVMIASATLRGHGE